MKTKIKTQVLVLIVLTNFLNFVKVETKEIEEEQIADTKENFNIILQHILTLSKMVEQLDDDADKLHKGFNQQAEIIYGLKNKLLGDEKSKSKDISDNYNKKIQEFFKNYKQQMNDLKENTHFNDTLNENANLLWKKIDQITEIFKSLYQCLETEDETSSPQNISKTIELLNDLENRLEIYEQKIEQLDEKEVDLDISSENLSKILIKLKENVDTQNQYLDNLEKQLILIQGASRTLDDFVVKKNERHSWHLNNRGHQGRNRHQRNEILPI